MNVEIYTDGSCLNNQAKDVESPGGYGVVLKCKGHEKCLSGGIEDTTNIRAEMIAVIKSLEALKVKCTVKLYTDSKFIVDSINNNWKRNKNQDLWKEIDSLITQHNVEFIWVRGHNGDENNEKANTLAQLAASKLSMELARKEK